MNGWYAAVKVLINALCFIMGYLVAMVIRVTLFLLVQFFICFIVYVQSMCVPILRSIGTKLTKLEHMQKSRFILFIWRHVTQKRYVMRHGDSRLLIDILTRNILKPTRSLYDFRFKSYGSNSGFRVFGDLDLDLWPMFYCLQGSHRVWKTGKTGKKIMVREKSGKSQGILFWAKSQGKVREFCFKLPIAMKICCYSCRLSRMFVTVMTVFINMKVYMWILKNFCIFHCFQVFHQQH